MDIEELISEMNAKHYDQIRKSLQVVISPNDRTMNPNLTANLRADRELKLKLIREALKKAQPYLLEANELMGKVLTNHAQIASHIADTLHYCNKAIHEIDQNPQPDQ